MKTSAIYIRVEPGLKKEAETVLSDLGLSLSSAITLFFKQIVIHNGLPFEVKKPINGIANYELMNDDELKNQISAGNKVIDDDPPKTVKAPKVYKSLDDPELIKAVKEGFKQIEDGNYVDFEDVVKEFHDKYGV